MLFLNKKDLFLEKIQRVDLSVCFPQYSGGKNYDNGLKYIEMQFKAMSPSDKPLYVHITCAIDSDNIQFVFTAVKDTILRNILNSAGLYGY